MNLEINDHRDGSFILNRIIIIVDKVNSLNFTTYFGKIVMAKIICNKEELSSEKIGILNSVKYLKESIINYYIRKKIKTLKIENNLIEEDDNMSLFSLGIKSDFTCFIECEE